MLKPRSDYTQAVSWPCPSVFFTASNSHSAQGEETVVGIAAHILSIAVVFTPLPLSNIAQALAIAVISLAYLEDDGLLLATGLLFAAILLTIESIAIWGTVVGAAEVRVKTRSPLR
jgi:hypothetical protein